MPLNLSAADTTLYCPPPDLNDPPVHVKKLLEAAEKQVSPQAPEELPEEAEEAKAYALHQQLSGWFEQNPEATWEDLQQQSEFKNISEETLKQWLISQMALPAMTEIFRLSKEYGARLPLEKDHKNFKKIFAQYEEATKPHYEKLKELNTPFSGLIDLDLFQEYQKQVLETEIAYRFLAYHVGTHLPTLEKLLKEKGWSELITSEEMKTFVTFKRAEPLVAELFRRTSFEGKYIGWEKAKNDRHKLFHPGAPKDTSFQTKMLLDYQARQKETYKTLEALSKEFPGVLDLASLKATEEKLFKQAQGLGWLSQNSDLDWNVIETKMNEYQVFDLKPKEEIKRIAAQSRAVVAWKGLSEAVYEIAMMEGINNETGTDRLIIANQNRKIFKTRLEKIAEEFPDIVPSNQIEETVEKISRNAKETIQKSKDLKETPPSPDKWYQTVYKVIPKSGEFLAHMIDGAGVYYVGGLQSLFDGKGFKEGTQYAVDNILKNQKIANERLGGSLLGNPEEFAKAHLATIYLQANPITIAGSGIGGVFQGAEEGYGSYARWVAGFSEERYRRDGFTQAGKWSFKAGLAAGGLALTPAQRITQILLSSGGMSATSAIGQELILASQNDRSIDLGNIAGNTADGTASSLFFMGAISKFTRLAASQKYGVKLPVSGSLSSTQLQAVRHAQALGFMIDVSEGLSSLPDVVQTLAEARKRQEKLGALLLLGSNVYDTAGDAFVTGAYKHVAKSKPTFSPSKTLSPEVLQNMKLNDQERIAEANRITEKILKRELTAEEKQRVLRTHKIGSEKGESVGNYSFTTLKEKMGILQSIGQPEDNPQQLKALRKALMKRGITGAALVTIEKTPLVDPSSSVSSQSTQEQENVILNRFLDAIREAPIDEIDAIIEAFNEFKYQKDKLTEKELQELERLAAEQEKEIKIAINDILNQGSAYEQAFKQTKLENHVGAKNNLYHALKYHNRNNELFDKLEAISALLGKELAHHNALFRHNHSQLEKARHALQLLENILEKNVLEARNKLDEVRGIRGKISVYQHIAEWEHGGFIKIKNIIRGREMNGALSKNDVAAFAEEASVFIIEITDKGIDFTRGVSEGGYLLGMWFGIPRENRPYLNRAERKDYAATPETNHYDEYARVRFKNRVVALGFTAPVRSSEVGGSVLTPRGWEYYKLGKGGGGGITQIYNPHLKGPYSITDPEQRKALIALGFPENQEALPKEALIKKVHTVADEFLEVQRHIAIAKTRAEVEQAQKDFEIILAQKKSSLQNEQLEVNQRQADQTVYDQIQRRSIPRDLAKLIKDQKTIEGAINQKNKELAEQTNASVKAARLPHPTAPQISPESNH